MSVARILPWMRRLSESLSTNRLYRLVPAGHLRDHCSKG
jgi:hypothetical protein